MKEYKIKKKQKACYPFDTWITKLEMRAFGWHLGGSEVEYSNIYDLDVDWDKKEITAKRRFTVYNTFQRVSPYSKNVLFHVLEFFMKIHSWIRRKLIFLLFGLIILGLGIGTILYLVGDTGSGIYLLASSAAMIGVIYVPSLIYSLLGYLVRVIFRIEKKLQDSLEKNGYARNQL